MKPYLTILFFSTCLSINAYCQTYDTIYFEYDRIKNELKPITNDELFRYRKKTKKEYVFKLEGINTSYFTIKINPKASAKVINTPDILKAIMPGITSNDQLPLYNVKSLFIERPTANTEEVELDKIFRKADEDYNKLTFLLSESKKLIKHINTYYYELNNCINTGRSTLSSINSKFGVSDIEKLRDTLSYVIKDFQSNYDLIQRIIPTLPHAMVLQERVYEPINDLYIRNTFIVENKDILFKCIDFIDEVTKAKSSIATKPFKLEGDYATVNTIIIKNPIVSSKSISDTILKDSKNFYAKKYWDFDFSTGFFFNTLYNRDYFLKDNNGTKTIETEKNPAFDISIGALAHLSYKCSSKGKIGTAIGAGLSPLDGKTRYLLGLSYIRGRKQQLAFTIGGAVAKIKALSDVVSSDNKSPKDVLPSGISSVPTFDQWRIGLFFGFTYNLSK